MIKGHTPTQADRDAAQNRLNIHARVVDYPGGEIGFNRDIALTAHRIEATAPLLEALRAAKSWIEGDGEVMGPMETRLHRALLTQIDAALTKAGAL